MTAIFAAHDKQSSGLHRRVRCVANWQRQGAHWTERIRSVKSEVVASFLTNDTGRFVAEVEAILRVHAHGQCDE